MQHVWAAAAVFAVAAVHMSVHTYTNMSVHMSTHMSTHTDTTGLGCCSCLRDRAIEYEGVKVKVKQANPFSPAPNPIYMTTLSE